MGKKIDVLLNMTQNFLLNFKKDKIRKNLGQAKDRKKACKGLHQQKVQLYQNLYAATFMLKECILNCGTTLKKELKNANGR